MLLPWRAEFGVLARDFGIVQLNGVGGAATDSHGGLLEPKPRALIAALDHEQRWHVLESPKIDLRRQRGGACG